MQSAEMTLRGRTIVGGVASGKALVTTEAISFLGGVDPSTGRIVERGHELYGKSVKDSILVFPSGKGSTVGSYVIYALRKHRTAPAGMINEETETIIATGCVLAEIPLVDRLSGDLFELAATGDHITLDADRGAVILRKTCKC